MKTPNDDTLQEWLEGGNAPQDADQNAAYVMYRHVFEALRTEPAYALPADFSDRMVRLTASAATRRQTIRFYLWVATVCLITLLLGIVSVAFIDKPLITNLFAFVWQERWIFVFGAALFVLIQAGDHWVKKHLLLRAYR